MITSVPVPTVFPKATAFVTIEPTYSPTPSPTPSPTSSPTPTSSPSPTPSWTPTALPPPLSPSSEQITRVEPGQGEIALLFNADYFPGHIDSILDTLQAHETHLTFFLTGSYLDRFPDQVRALDAAGHEIASHGYEHVDFRELGDEQIVSALDRWHATFKGLTGKSGQAYWQPPYGYSNSRVRQVAADHGYTTIYWTLDSLDAVGEPKSKSFVIDRVLGTSWVDLDGAIILMHVDKDGTVEALPEILDTLAQRGLRAVTVSELLRR